MKRIEMTKKSKLWLIAALSAIMIFTLAACGGSDKNSSGLEDGTYTAEFTTDSRMFHVNETKDGKGTLTVKDGKMTFHVSLQSEKILNLFVGKAKDAKKDGADVLEPTKDTVTDPEGKEETVNGFDIPVKKLDEEFDLALIGTKGKWYDHKVSITDVQPQ
mgnify:CR=1 FL=1